MIGSESSISMMESKSISLYIGHMVNSFIVNTLHCLYTALLRASCYEVTAELMISVNSVVMLQWN